MKNRTYLVFLHIILFISLIGNIILAYKEPSQETVLTPTNSVEMKIEKVHEKILSVYVLPHPPDFLSGRTIYFKDYSTVSKDGKKYIIFSEKRGTHWVKTKVDSEAVRWK